MMKKRLNEVVANCVNEIQSLPTIGRNVKGQPTPIPGQMFRFLKFLEWMDKEYWTRGPLTWKQAAFCYSSRQNPKYSITHHCLKNCEGCPRSDDWLFEAKQEEVFLQKLEKGTDTLPRVP